MDILGIVSDKLLKPRIETSLHGLGVALQRRLAPADVPVFIRDLDEEPARRDAEVFHRLDRGHGSWCSVTLRLTVELCLACGLFFFLWRNQEKGSNADKGLKRQSKF